MSTPEQNLWVRLEDAMRGYWIPQRIESGTNKGIPDVYFSIPQNSGWIELKVIAKLPTRDTTPVKLPKFYGEQKLWIVKHGRITESVWILIYVIASNDYFLFPSHMAYDIDGALTGGEWMLHCSLYMRSRIDAGLLYNKLLEGCGSWTQS